MMLCASSPQTSLPLHPLPHPQPLHHLTWAVSRNVGSELPMLGHLQAQAVYAPVRVAWTLISDSGVGQRMVLCIFTMKQGS